MALAPLPPPNAAMVQSPSPPSLAYAQYLASLDALARAAVAPWTAYTPSVASRTGLLTTASATGAFVRVGKTIHYRVAITIATNGTGATLIDFGLPATTLTTSAIGAGRENIVTGKMLQAFAGAGATTGSVIFYDNGYPGADGAQLFLSGTYEAQ